MSLDELRDLCAKHWNPMSIPMANTTTEEKLGFRPLPVDEYDSYLSHAQNLLESGASSGEIRTYLETVERDYLMLSAPDGDKDAFIRALQAASHRS